MAIDKAGNTLKKAKKLGTFDNGTISFKDAISTSDKNDLHVLNLAGRSSFDLTLSGLKSNADVEIFQLARNKATVLKEIGSTDFSKLAKAALKRNIRSIAKSSLGAKTNEAINLNLAAGEYYIRVYQRQGNTKYTLNLAGHSDNAGEDLASARDITTDAAYTDYVGKADAGDVYRFSLVDMRNVNVALNGLSADANLTLLNSSGVAIASSNNASTIPEAIAQQLAAGQYYVRVSSTGSSTPYSLQIGATAVPVPSPVPAPAPVPAPTPTPTPAPGDSFATAINLTFSSSLTKRGTVNDSSKVDYYKFTPLSSSDLSLLMKDLTANANIELLDSTEAVLQVSALSGQANESIHYPLTANKPYYLKISQVAAGTSTGYTLDINLPADKFGDTEAQATSFNISSNAENPTVFSDYAGGILQNDRFSEEDYFKFTLTGRSQFRLVLDQLNHNLDVAVYKQGASDRIISARTGTAKEELGGNLEAGTYFVRIHPNTSGIGSTYTLKLSADPTQSDPTITRDINFGAAGSNASFVTDVNGTVYFAASDGAESALWKSNGTLDGTVKVKSFTSLSNFVSFNGTLYFTAKGDSAGVELWKSNGTSAGTVRVTDLAEGAGDANLEQLTVVGNNLYFWAATNSNRPDEKFLYYLNLNNTSNTNTPVRIENGGQYSVMSNEFTNVNGTLYYRGLNQTGTELFRINNAGTSNPDAPEVIYLSGSNPTYAYPSDPTKLTAVGNSLFFVATSYNEGRELHRITNGSNEVAVFDADNTFSASVNNAGDMSWRIVMVGSTLYFSANDGNSNGEELWKIENAETAASNSEVRVRVTSDGAIALNPLNLTSFNGQLYFTADDGVNGRELWVSNGTEAGTKLLKDININSGEGSTPDELTVVGSFLYFSANDGDSSTENTAGRELWKTNGTTAGTVLVKDIYSGGTSTNGVYSPNNSNPADLTVASGQLYFLANNGSEANGQELWVIP